MFVSRSGPYTLDNTVSNMLLGQQQIGSYKDRYLSRGTIVRLRGLSIGVESNIRVGAVAPITNCATDLLRRCISIGILGINTV